MITSNDLKGIMTMMPAFTKKDGDRMNATDTVDTDELARTVDKIITDDGCNVLTTTGSFGEFPMLLWDEHKKLIAHIIVDFLQKRFGQSMLFHQVVTG